MFPAGIAHSSVGALPVFPAETGLAASLSPLIPVDPARHLTGLKAGAGAERPRDVGGR